MEFKFKSMKSERSILGWDRRSVGFKCLAHMSGKHQLLPKALARPLEQEMGAKKCRRLVVAGVPSVLGPTAGLEHRALLT